jgi:hypothetical protein
MKFFSFKIGSWDFDEIFSPVRRKHECIRLLMNTLKLMIVNDEVNEDDSPASMILVVSRMSRLFYVSEKKYFSINFPFNVEQVNGELRFYSRHIQDIDSFVTSKVLEVMSSLENFESDCIFTFAEPIEEIERSIPYFWPFIRELMMFEEGYIRYDHDAQNENGSLHPLSHYDVFYSSNATFKIGLRNHIGYETLIDLLKLETDCHFLDCI